MSVQALSCAMVMRGVSASEKLLLLVLANFADEEMRCWPSHKRLADDTCLSQRTILTLLKGLEERRVLSRQERFRKDGSRTSDYITLHFSGEVVSPPPEIDDTGVGKLATPGGAIISPLTTFEPTTEPSKNPTITGADDWRRMLLEAREAAGDTADLTCPAMHHAADLRALVEPRTGEPCTWDEVLDAIAMTAMRQRAKGKLIPTWKWVGADAIALRDKRLNAANPEAADFAPLRATGPPGGITDKIAAENAEARRRAFEMLDAEHGPKN